VRRVHPGTPVPCLQHRARPYRAPICDGSRLPGQPSRPAPHGISPSTTRARRADGRHHRHRSVRRAEGSAASGRAVSSCIVVSLMAGVRPRKPGRSGGRTTWTRTAILGRSRQAGRPVGLPSGTGICAYLAVDDFRFRVSSISCGTIVNRSPTTPKSAGRMWIDAPALLPTFCGDVGVGSGLGPV
jgi:hypothetical protein